MFSKELGIDLGTMFTRLADTNQVMLEEPTIVAIELDPNRMAEKMVAYGQEARDMVGRVPESIEVARPLKNGVIADYEVTQTLLAHLIRRASGSLRFVRPRVMISIPYGVTSVERRAVYEAVMEAGAHEANLIPQPLAAALGIDLPIGSPSGNMVICLGGGCTEAAVLAMYGIVSADTLRVGGLELDEAIVTYVRRKYGVIIGQVTAELLKVRIGAAVPRDEEQSMEVQGQDQVTGLPRPVTLSTDEIAEALQDPLKQIMESCRRVLEKTPPELVSDIIDRGVAICGGGALLRGVDKLLTKSLGVPAYLVDNPLTCVVEGAAKGIPMYNVLRRSLPQV
ncbi:MAG: rod shape-determining protein [Anaerolineaceae bacterium]|jgi:rod shape-determining protein MreB|nr:rod shape-determining protein [Anaerolineales bacterium]MCC7512720.1 rod shape-determining protein [Anaerolineae bacterium]NOG74691.1 rod shape-determining protein [Chloroflexota bacterium]GER80886.1 rod shape-determining protein [Candidatus Denitrolinea symbiosum]GJQ38473.1 MAG: rod shape-determining protein [Anaerolineaceae bacterium]